MSPVREIVVYIALSVDGFIAGPSDDLGFLSMVEQQGEDYGYHDFIASVSTVLLGRKTYDKVQSFGIGNPHADRECFVFSRTHSGDHDGVRFVNSDPVEFCRKLREQAGGRIFVDGGAEIIQCLLRADMIDRIILSYIPCMLGAGTRLFGDQGISLDFQLQSVRPFASSLLQVEYTRSISPKDPN